MVSADLLHYEHLEEVAQALERMRQMRLDLEWSIFMLENYLDQQ